MSDRSQEDIFSMLCSHFRMPVEMGLPMPVSARGTVYVARSISIPNHMLSESFDDNEIIKYLADKCLQGCGDMVSIRTLESVKGQELTSIYVRLCLEYKSLPVLYEKISDYYDNQFKATT